MEVANDLQSETASVKVNNFDIKLSRNNDQLTIDAEHNDTLKRYSLTITSENVKDITRFLFRDVEMMYLELLEALEQKAPAGVTISITDDARIIYAQEKEVRGRKSKEDFTLWLDEEKIDREKEQEKRIDKLLKQVAQQEARIAVLEQEKKSYNERIQALEEENSNFKKLEERLTKKMQDLEGTVEQRLAKRIQTLEEENRRLDEKLTGRIQTLEGKAIPETQQMLKTTFADLERKINLMVPETEKIKTSLADFEKKTNERMQALSGELARKEFEFDPTCKRANCFSMSAGNKTITKTATDGKWIYCSAKQILSRNLQTVFSVKIDSTSRSHVIVGIFPSNLKTEDDVLTKEGTYYYYHLPTHEGIGANGKENALNPKNSIPNATIITVNVDLAQNTINYQINGVSIATTNLEASQTSSYIYYPFVCLQDTNDKVSFM